MNSFYELVQKVLVKSAVNKHRRGDTMRTSHEKHVKTFVQREISVVMKKAYCGFERLTREHDEKILALMEDVRNGRLRVA